MNEKRCPLCGGFEEESKTTVTVELGFGVVVVRSVPAMVCNQCGEYWLNDEIAETVENIVKDAKERHSVVEVVSLEDHKLAS